MFVPPFDVFVFLFRKCARIVQNIISFSIFMILYEIYKRIM